MACCGKKRFILKKRLAESQKAIKYFTIDNEWPAVRQRLRGKWAEKPDWCCKQLIAYLGSVHLAANNKLTIVTDYFLKPVFTAGKIKHPCISALRTAISSEIKKRKVQGKWQ